MATSTLSAPGKVLIAGGYLVLERPNCGVVVTVNARIHVTVRTPTEESMAHIIEVRSPQFNYVQQFSLSTNGGFLLQPVSGGTPNVFILYGVWFALAYAALFGPEFPARISSGMIVEINGDAAFYAGEGGKTGLGSSAALTAALCGSLLHFCGVREQPVDSQKPQASLAAATHRVAQAAHATAQGKLGSGFDIASAAFGSGVYVRFSDLLIRAVMTKVPQCFHHHHHHHHHSWRDLSSAGGVGGRGPAADAGGGGRAGAERRVGSPAPSVRTAAGHHAGTRYVVGLLHPCQAEF
jgi:phosphomevalonate kinase